MKGYKILAYLKSGSRDPELLVRPKTQDPVPNSEVGLETQDFKSGTRKPRHSTLTLHGTQQLKPKTLKGVPRTLMIGETRDPGTQEL